MLNFGLRHTKIEELKHALVEHEKQREIVEYGSRRLFERRQRAVGEIVVAVEDYVNHLANSPKDFDKTVAEYRVEVNSFDETVERLNIEAAQSNKTGGTAGVAGAAAGVGVAVLGSTAAMAIATTFGTASTGVAISTLSGAAATNAALAWLGGGALAAGGGGMVGGQAILALAGPVGWTVGGLALVGSGWYWAAKNFQISEEASCAKVNVVAEKKSLEAAGHEIWALGTQTEDHMNGCLEDLNWLQSEAPQNYKRFDENQKNRLQALVNHIHSLSELLRTKVVL